MVVKRLRTSLDRVGIDTAALAVVSESLSTLTDLATDSRTQYIQFLSVLLCVLFVCGCCLHLLA